MQTFALYDKLYAYIKLFIDQTPLYNLYFEH